MSKTDHYSDTSILHEALIKSHFIHHFRLHKMFKPTPVYENWRIDENRNNNDLHMLYVIEGSCNYILNLRKIVLKKGQIIIVSNGFIHSATKNSNKPLHMFSLRFGLYSNQDLTFRNSFFKEPFTIIKTPKDPLVYELILNRMYQHFLGQKPESLFAINTLINQLLLNVCEEPQNIDITEKINSISNYIIMKHGKDVDVISLADIMNLSVKQFSKLFTKYNQITPHQFIIKTRINYAKYLLEETNLSVGMIAEELQYNDPFCFSKQFKKVVKVSPTSYRIQIESPESNDV